MNLFVSLLPVFFQLLLGLEEGNRSNNSSELPVSAPMMVCDRRSDSLELVKFYNATGGPNWWKKWDLKMSMNTWFGIKLNNEGCVSGILLNDTLYESGRTGNNVTGSFVPLNLPNLKDLNLVNNHISGNLFDLENLRSLELLNIFGNPFNGSIPNFDLPSLKLLAISRNNLTGSIPKFDKLPKLEVLEIAYTQISDTIPDFDLPSLVGLYLHSNILIGKVPNFTNLPNLEVLELYGNRLTDTIPNFNSLPLLKTLWLGGNQLSGTIPNFINLPNLVNLNIDNNILDGQIPEFDRLLKLQSLSIRSNKLVGPLSPFSKCPNLIEINVSDNELSGYVPDYSIYLPAVSSISIRDNKFSFTGIIQNAKKIQFHTKKTSIGGSPDSLLYHPQQKIYSDTTITISPNTNYILDLRIDDTVTTSTYYWYKNDTLIGTIKGSNKLPFTPFTSNDAGTYTVKITNLLAPQLTLESWPIRLIAAPQLICDRRSDSLELINFYNTTGGPKIPGKIDTGWTTKWNLSNPMNTWWGVTLNSNGCVEKIELSSSKGPCCDGNGLINQMPDLNLPYLQTLNVTSNKITGQLPNFNLPSLENLIFQTNELKDTLPIFDKMPNLRLLNLFQNNIGGKLHTLANLKNLEELSLWHNQLTGSIPQLDLPKLKKLDISGNLFSGTIPNFSKMPLLEQFDIYNGHLIGPLPNFINMPKLKILNAGNQNINDTIPDFTNLPDLISLDLHSNLFTGNIPRLKNSFKLESLDLSYNYVTGVIPDFNKSHLKLSELAYSVNKFTFQSMIHNLSFNKNHTDFVNRNCPTCTYDTLRYAQQRLIYSDTTINIPSCTDYTLDLKIDDTVTTSTYAWFKNGVPDTIIKGNNKRRFTNFNSAHVGTYTVKITNPLAPQLTLESHPIRLAVGTGLCCDRRSDSLELLNFFKTTGGPDWTNKQGWDDPTKPLTIWYGVSLNSMGCVQAINLNGNKVTGQMPNLNLPGLETLSLQNNSLKDTIPNFDKLPLLIKLDLGLNPFTGAVPDLAKCPLLEYISFNNCLLRGTIPPFSHLINLKFLALAANRNDLLGSGLTGSLPTFTQNTKLAELIVNDNLLDGNIHNFNLPNLKVLFLHRNKFFGNIPSLSKCTLLENFELGTNRLTGKLPDFGFFPKLVAFTINNNLISDTLPRFKLNPLLLELWLHNNYFTGDMVDFEKDNPSLRRLTLDSNKLTFKNIIDNLAKNKNLVEVKNQWSQSKFSYAPQQKIYADTTINIPPCTDYTLDLKIDDTVTTSTYTWFKDGSPFMPPIKGTNKLTFKNFTSANNGTYTVSITNPLAPQLTLESHPIRLTTSGAMASINNPRDTSLSCGLSFTLRPINGQNLTNPAYFTGSGRTGTQYNAGQVITTSTILYAHSGTGNCADEDTFRILFVNPDFILRPDTTEVQHKKPAPFGVLANDQIPAGLSPTITIDQPQNGRIIYSQSTGQGTYTPNDNFSGKEVLNYTVCIIGCPQNTCKSSTITFEVEGPCGDRNSLVLPNIIFPTGSGANRFFIVEAITKCPNSWGLKPHKLQVFNRWGDLVYRNDNYLNDWTGTNTAGQPLPEGTYYYLLDLGSVAAPIKGYVAIVR